MWIDTFAASPVTACTWAASAIFSQGSRGVPGVVNTLNRVPEFPYAQLGTSMEKVSKDCSAFVGTGVMSCFLLFARGCDGSGKAAGCDRLHFNPAREVVMPWPVTLLGQPGNIDNCGVPLRHGDVEV